MSSSTVDRAPLMPHSTTANSSPHGSLESVASDDP